LISAIIPPGATHVHPVHSAALTNGSLIELAVASGFLGSLLADFTVRAVPKSEILYGTIRRMPYSPEFGTLIALRTLRLNSVTRAYAPLWEECFNEKFLDDHWAAGYSPSAERALASIERAW